MVIATAEAPAPPRRAARVSIPTRWLLTAAAWTALAWMTGRVDPTLALLPLAVWLGFGIALLVQSWRLLRHSRTAAGALLGVVALLVAVALQPVVLRVAADPPGDADMIASFAALREGLDKKAETQPTFYEEAWSRGHVTTRTISKGYLRSRTAPSPLIESLDRNWTFAQLPFGSFRRMEGDWYLYLDAR
jgi:hypothetical protein